MKTHPESLWLDGTRIDLAKSLNSDFYSVVVVNRKFIDTDVEFVPASVYSELKEKHERFEKYYYMSLKEMAKARQEKQEIEGSVMFEFCHQMEQAEECGGQFKVMFDAWQKMKSELSALKKKSADIWSAGYVAGQKAVTEGPQRNPYARIEGA